MTIAVGEQALASDVALGANMPSGSIIIWSGTIASIPAGWIICDGNSGTPNLLAKFIEGVATAATNPGTTGGSISKSLTASVNVDVLGSPGSWDIGIADIRPPYYDVAFLFKT